MSKLKKCPRCSRDVFKGTKKCPHCGYEFADYCKPAPLFCLSTFLGTIAIQISDSDMHSRSTAAGILFVVALVCFIGSLGILFKEMGKG